ncbi:hypothetical protein ElyMa_005595600 [Elysia marginata]|uniref:Uncharacterized protein n=1 Tax=Elysia marginata TaxID=1093978 RepID=A0AAV4F5A8_9GAST|nr:hypothetical protein ElyMa_005595600 [Elysia marginata]
MSAREVLNPALSVHTLVIFTSTSLTPRLSLKITHETKSAVSRCSTNPNTNLLSGTSAAQSPPRRKQQGRAKHSQIYLLTKGCSLIDKDGNLCRASTERAPGGRGLGKDVQETRGVRQRQKLSR